MIEELQLILNAIGDLTDVAIYVVVAFMGYQLFINLAAMCLVVFIIKTIAGLIREGMKNDSF